MFRKGAGTHIQFFARFFVCVYAGVGNCTRENSIKMYRQSLENFHTDYLDYYLLHNTKTEELFNKRFRDNGVIDFLMEERKAGRIRNLGFSFHGNKEGFDSMIALHEKYHWDFVLIQLNYLDWNHAGNPASLQQMRERRSCRHR